MQHWNIAIGNFFFRYRNALFPLVIGLASLTLRPQVMFDNWLLDRLLLTGGFILALTGQAVRLITIGFEYIHRGGRDGKVYAGRLVQGGVYGLTRNPMYLGNSLITIGVTMLFGSPVGYLLLIPFFLFVYQAIIAAEEAYLRNKFGAEYDEYAAAVNRIWPSLSRIKTAFAGMRFDWRRSIKKDMGTVVGLTIGLNILPVWRSYFLYDADTTKVAAMRSLWIILGLTAIYLVMVKLKRSKRLFQEPTNAK
jgi:protein-S-isoprenylcysteine O-methyltransferase Ste14